MRAADRIVNGVVAEVIELAVLHARLQKGRELRFAGDLAKIGFGDYRRPMFST